MKFNKTISTLVLGLMFSGTVISPASAVEINQVNAPKADFTSIWNHVQNMITEINAGTNRASAPVAAPTPAPAPAATPAPATKPAPAPAPSPAPTPTPATKPAPAPAPSPAPTPTPATKPAPAPVPAPTPATKPAPAPVPAPTPATNPAPAPTAKPAPATTPTADFTPSQFEQEVVRLVNIERGKEGLKPLVLDNLLCKGATSKSQDFINEGYFGHTSPKYGSPFDMMKSFGVKYSAAGENIASGQKTPAAVVQAWMNSPGHRANIMSTKYGKIGVGYAYTSGGNYHHYWTQWFTN